MHKNVTPDTTAWRVYELYCFNHLSTYYVFAYITFASVYVSLSLSHLYLEYSAVGAIYLLIPKLTLAVMLQQFCSFMFKRIHTLQNIRNTVGITNHISCSTVNAAWCSGGCCTTVKPTHLTMAHQADRTDHYAPVRVDTSMYVTGWNEGWKSSIFSKNPIQMQL